MTLTSAVDPVIEIDAVDQEGRGVGRVDGKVVFVEGAVTGERVVYRAFQQRSSHEFATVTRVLRESALRVTPKCPYFEHCGGCSMQHIDARAQVAIKQRILEDNLRRLGGVTPDVMLPPLHGPAWGYRHRARLSVRFLRKKNEVLVGFNDRRTHRVVDMRSCEILPAAVSAALGPLRDLFREFENREQIAQVEIAVGDDATVFVVRHLKPLTQTECEALRRFGKEREFVIYLQPKGPKSIHPIGAVSGTLGYRLNEFNVSFVFGPTDFTQINYAINQVLVRRVIGLLQPQPDDRIGDFFCGLGNFSLPMARRGATVLGIEGDETLVARARENAIANGLSDRVTYVAADLAKTTHVPWGTLGRLDKLLIDPPRQGAAAVVESLPAQDIRRLVYVSCNPATLARDAGMLVRERGYRLAAASVVNMFPHTAHVESIALFER